MDDPYDNFEIWINNIMRIYHGKLSKDLYDMLITNNKLNGYASVKFYDFQTKLNSFWSKHVQNKSSHLVMSLKQEPNRPKPKDNNTMAMHQSQIRNLTDIISNMKQDAQ